MDHNTIESGGIILGLLGAVACGVATAGVSIGKLFRRVKTLEETQAASCEKIHAIEEKNAAQDTAAAVLLEKINGIEKKIDASDERQEKQNDLIIRILQGRRAGDA